MAPAGVFDDRYLNNASVFVAVAVLMRGVGIVACLLLLRRGLRVEPTVALHAEV